MLLDDAPKPLRKPVILIYYANVKFFLDAITKRSVTSIQHMISLAPFDYYSKKQATLETVTYGSKFVAAHI